MRLDFNVSTKFQRLAFWTSVPHTIHGSARQGKTQQVFVYNVFSFKNYFATMFSTISFQFLAICGIQTDPKMKKSKNKTSAVMWENLLLHTH